MSEDRRASIAGPSLPDLLRQTGFVASAGLLMPQITFTSRRRSAGLVLRCGRRLQQAHNLFLA
jgi:hypothetical protein